jgi:hypothetical protein
MEVKIPSDERAASTAVPNSVVIRLKIPPPRPETVQRFYSEAARARSLSRREDHIHFNPNSGSSFGFCLHLFFSFMLISVQRSGSALLFVSFESGRYLPTLSAL